jgi:DNA-binding CsgD family transcriptional regulator
MGAYAWVTAAERLRAAAALLAGVDGAAGTRGRLLHRLANLERFSDPAGAIAPCAEAEVLAAKAGDAVLAAEARRSRGLFLCYSDRTKEGLAAMVEGIEALEAMPLVAAEVLANVRALFVAAIAGAAAHPTADDELAAARLRSEGLDFLRCVPVWFSALAGQSREAIAAGERFLTVLALGPGATDGIHWTAAFADHGLGIAYAALGRPDDARRAWARSRAFFRDIGHHVLVAFSHLNELWDVVYPFGPTDPGARRRHAAGAEAALSRAGGALAAGVSPRLAWLSCLVLDGRWDEARQILQDLPTPGNSCLRREVSGPYATLARHRGDPETAWERIRPLFPEGPATEPGDLIHQEGLFLQRLAADLCLDADDLAGGRAWLEAHDRWLAWSESVLGQADGRLAWARWHRAAADKGTARTAASDALALAEDPRQPLVVIAAHRLLGELATAAGEHAAAAAHLTAALELATACEAPFERALTLLALAELRLAMTATDEAATLLDEVRRICAALGATPTLGRADAVAARLSATRPAEAYPAGLTQREAEVLRLLARRLSNPEIAAALFVSPRTVQTHVEHILAKLGVNNRREAAEAAVRLGLG